MKKDIIENIKITTSELPKVFFRAMAYKMGALSKAHKNAT